MKMKDIEEFAVNSLIVLGVMTFVWTVMVIGLSLMGVL